MRDIEYFIALKAKAFQEALKNGKPYQRGSERGVFYRGKRWAIEIRSPVITGRKFKGACNCPTPPWEECEHKLAA